MTSATITLTHPAAAAGLPLELVLPDDLAWTDEHSYSPVVQAMEHTTTGALVIDTFTKQAGRSITLSGADDRAWVRYADLETLRTWSQTAGLVMALLLRGATRSVVFDFERGAVESEPVMFYAVPAADDPYRVALRFVEV